MSLEFSRNNITKTKFHITTLLKKGLLQLIANIFLKKCNITHTATCNASAQIWRQNAASIGGGQLGLLQFAGLIRIVSVFVHTNFR